jgi:hypothetical protein
MSNEKNSGNTRVANRGDEKTLKAPAMIQINKGGNWVQKKNKCHTQCWFSFMAK